MVKFKVLFKTNLSEIITDNEQAIVFLRNNPDQFKEDKSSENLALYCSILDIEERALKSRNRSANTVRKRHAIINQLISDGLNKSEVARLLNLDHTSVLYAVESDEMRKTWDYLYEPLKLKLKKEKNNVR